MTQGDIDAGVIELQIGFTPSRPAEFVVPEIRLRAAPRQASLSKGRPRTGVDGSAMSRGVMGFA